MKQQTLAAAADQGAGFEQYRRATKRDVFLATMEQIVPWSELCAVIEPHYPKPGNGRPPVRWLRFSCVRVGTRPVSLATPRDNRRARPSEARFHRSASPFRSVSMSKWNPGGLIAALTGSDWMQLGGIMHC